MEELKELEKLVCNLREADEEEEQIARLQEINTELLQHYIIEVDDITIRPLWVEVYYFDKKKFPDCNSHMSEKQKNRFGQLYFHEIGRGGLDICLSAGKDYYLSVLLKVSCVVHSGKEEILKQTAIYDAFDKPNGAKIKAIEAKTDVLKRTDVKWNKIILAKRVNPPRPCYKTCDLAAVPLEVIKEPAFADYRACFRDAAEAYIKEYKEKNPNCTKKAYEEKCVEIFGWLPDNVREYIKSLFE